MDSDTYFNDASTQQAARAAAGSLIELASQVAEGRLRNGFACIRPPGHHAEKDQVEQSFERFLPSSATLLVFKVYDPLISGDGLLLLQQRRGDGKTPARALSAAVQENCHYRLGEYHY